MVEDPGGEDVVVKVTSQRLPVELLGTFVPVLTTVAVRLRATVSCVGTPAATPP